MSEMIPCPICESSGEILQESISGSGYYPRCSNRRCILFNTEADGEFGTTYVSFKTKEEAIKAWNTRPIEDALLEAAKAALIELEWLLPYSTEISARKAAENLRAAIAQAEGGGG